MTDIDVDQAPALDEGQEPSNVDWMQVHEVRNFGRRAMAAGVDIILLMILYIVFDTSMGTLIHLKYRDPRPRPHVVVNTVPVVTGWHLMVYIAVCFLYFILLEWRMGWTVGKLLFSVRVVTMDEERISLGQSVIRNLMRAFDGLPYVIPYVMALSSVIAGANRQRWGDRLAKTLVVDSV